MGKVERAAKGDIIEKDFATTGKRWKEGEPLELRFATS
jgi:hypothetical protein